jgi:hypothetical protein
LTNKAREEKREKMEGKSGIETNSIHDVDLHTNSCEKHVTTIDKVSESVHNSSINDEHN